MSKERTSQSCLDVWTQQHSNFLLSRKAAGHEPNGEAALAWHLLGFLGLLSIFLTHSMVLFRVSSPHKSGLQIIYWADEHSFLTGLPLSLLSFVLHITSRFIILNINLIMTVSYPTAFDDTLGSKKSPSSLGGYPVPRTPLHPPASRTPSLASLAHRDTWSGFVV